MSVPGSILPPQRRPLDPKNAHWRNVLLEHFELVRRECRAELTSGHPGARHRVAKLLTLGANISAQLEALEAGR